MKLYIVKRTTATNRPRHGVTDKIVENLNKTVYSTPDEAWNAAKKDCSDHETQLSQRIDNPGRLIQLVVGNDTIYWEVEELDYPDGKLG